jgi:hypothetical protein
MNIVRSILTRLQALFAWWMADISRRPSLIGKLASLLIGLIIICCVCSTGLAAVRSTGQAVGLVATNTPTPRPTNTPSPTNTPEATDTPVPTATTAPSPTPVATETPVPTAVPPTAVPEPTSPPEPTAAPAAETQKLTAEERAAVGDIGRHLSNIGQGLGQIGELAQNPEGTDEWKIKMAAAIYLVQSNHEDLSKMTVPAKIEPLHTAVLKATTDCNAAMDKLATGLDTGNANAIRQATVLMQSCSQKIQEARPELDALQAQL